MFPSIPPIQFEPVKDYRHFWHWIEDTGYYGLCKFADDGKFIGYVKSIMEKITQNYVVLSGAYGRDYGNKRAIVTNFFSSSTHSELIVKYLEEKNPSIPISTLV